MKPFYITTAIDYANGKPHLGHAYEKVLADVIARYKRLNGATVFFVTGLDEHGQKVQQSAVKQSISPQSFCDSVAESFQDLCRQINITNDDYIRTTEERHKKAVCYLLQLLYDKGEIYQADYKGFYSVRAEQFVQEKDKENGQWPKIFGEVIEIKERNYFFKLSQYQDWLIDYLKTHEDFILPKFRTKQVIEFLKEPINDLCISRPIERLSWGIPLPFDKNYVTYVWFDALVNYLSAIGYDAEGIDPRWPADIHLIGKDILAPPHAVYWPIILKAVGLPLPKMFLVHGWWLQGGEKLSKSKGEVVNPLEWIERFGADAFRYFVIREMNVGYDSEFSEALFQSRYQGDLANDLGNLISRLLNMICRYCDGIIPSPLVDETPEQTIKTLWEKTKTKTLDYYANFQFHTALEQIFVFIRAINRYAEIRAPWKLAKSENDNDRQQLATTLALMAEGLRLVLVLLTPVMPNISERAHKLLGTQQPCSWQTTLKWSDTLSGNTIGAKTIFFPKE